MHISQFNLSIFCHLAQPDTAVDLSETIVQGEKLPTREYVQESIESVAPTYTLSVTAQKAKRPDEPGLSLNEAIEKGLFNAKTGKKRTYHSQFYLSCWFP